MYIKLEVGKYYKDRDSNVYGPMFHSNEFVAYPFTDGIYTFTEFGNYTTLGGEHFRDLVEEFSHNPPTEANNQKPPIGLTPINIFLELQNKQRVQDILDACYRYNQANMNIPQEWIDELSSRRGEVKIEHEFEHFAIPSGTTVDISEEVPKYMQDFEHDGSTYSVVEDTTRDGCDDCYFYRRKGCGSINEDFYALTGFKCHSSPSRIHFVKKQ